jgi:aquaporin Z
MEAGELAVYMLFACSLATLLQHPASPVQPPHRQRRTSPCAVRLAMGAAIIAIIMSPWGKQSGGHFNPAITFTFYRLAKVVVRGMCCFPLPDTSLAR